MRDDILYKIMGKFIRQTTVFGNFFLGQILRSHPELEGSDEVREMRRLLRELTEEEKHL